MTGWSKLPGEAQELYSPVGLRLIDDFTGGLPLGSVRAQLERRDSSGGWQATDIDVIRTPSGILAYPGLGRQAEVVGRLPRRYRVTLEAGIRFRRDILLSITYSEELIFPISATLQSTDRHHGIVGQARCHFQLDS